MVKEQSLSVLIKDYGTKVTVVCAQCGVEFQKRTGHFNASLKMNMKMYCSRACSSIAKRGKNKHNHEAWKRISEARHNEGNPNWKADKVTSRSVHAWVNFNWEKPTDCEICGHPNDGSRTFDWSNKNHKYSRIREEWQFVCRSCHTLYDHKHNGRILDTFKLKALK